MSKIFNLSEKVNFFILSLKKNKKYRLNDGEIGINLGSEDNTVKEYPGIDGSFLIYLSKSWLPSFVKRTVYNKSCTARHRNFESFVKNIGAKRIIHHNLAYGIPFKSESVQYLYTSHFLEHITEKDAVAIIKECYRCLKKGGLMRVVVPDLDDEVKRIEAAIKSYKKGNTKEVQEFLTIDGENHNLFSFHRRIYNFEDMKKILLNTGFREIKRKRFREGELPKVETIEKRDGLIIEARK